MRTTQDEIAVANGNIMAVIAELDANPRDLPACYSGYVQDIVGIRCQVFSSGCFRVGLTGHLPSDKLMLTEAQAAYDRCHNIVTLAKQYAIDNAKTLLPTKLYTHNGHKFIRI